MTRLSVRIKGFKLFKDRHGHMRCYNRATGTAIDLKKFPINSAGFIAECEKLQAVPVFVPPPARPGTFGLLTQYYLASYTFNNLRPVTQRKGRYEIGKLQVMKDKLLVDFTEPFLATLRDEVAKKSGWDKANRVLKRLSSMFSHAVEHGFMKSNTALNVSRIPRPRDTKHRHRRWTDEERWIVLERAPPHLRQAIGLIMYTGVRREDAVTLLKSALAKGGLAFSTSKNNMQANLSITRYAREAIDCWQHNATTICANSYGEPWTASGLQASFYKLKKQLEEEGLISPGLNFHGLRHTIGARTRELGFGETDVADILADRSPAMGRKYGEQANIAPKIVNIMSRIEADERKKRSKIVNPKK